MGTLFRVCRPLLLTATEPNTRIAKKIWHLNELKKCLSELLYYLTLFSIRKIGVEA